MQARTLLVVALTLLSAILVHGQQPCSTSTAGLPTSAGTYTVSNSTFNATAVNAWPSYAVAQSAVAYTVAALTDQSGVSYPAGSWVWWGNQPVVSVSSTQGQTWGLLNATGSDYPFNIGNALCAHRGSYNRFYVLGDTVNGVQGNVSFIYASNDGKSWSNVITAATQTAWVGRNLQLTGCVVDVANNVYSLGEDDVYVSSDQGVTWTNVSAGGGTQYTPRSSFAYGIFTASYGDVMVVLGGSAGFASSYGAYIQDAWVSQTGGKSWVQRTASAPWMGRTDPNLAISSSGVMVMQGGRSYANSAQVWLSDAWVSLDGAATWQLLNGNTALNRSASAAIFDSLGYLYLFSGESVTYAWNKDGWKSSYAVNNVNAWASGAAQQGALTVPSSFSACTPYYNVVAAPGGSSSSSSGAPAASSSTGGITGTSAPVNPPAGPASSSPSTFSSATYSTATYSTAVVAAPSSSTAIPNTPANTAHATAASLTSLAALLVLCLLL